MMDAEKDKMRSELEHHRKSLVYQDLDSKAHRLERSLKRSISNAKPYYELKAQLELQLQVCCVDAVWFWFSISRPLPLTLEPVCAWH